MSKGQLYAQYPTQDVMRRSAVMTYFGDQANKKISRMWIDMRCFDPRIKKIVNNIKLQGNYNNNFCLLYSLVVLFINEFCSTI
mgnify:CR=1 FL=1